MSDETIDMNIKGLEQLLKSLKQRPPVARIGILGDHAARKNEGKASTLSNAEIGALYEFNNGTNPDRPGGSFLRVPISDNLSKRMEKLGALDKQVLADVIRAGSVVPWLKKIAVLAEQIVSDAFDTGGFGKWKPSNMARKTNHQTLVETKQLRESITSEVKE